MRRITKELNINILEEYKISEPRSSSQRKRKRRIPSRSILINRKIKLRGQGSLAEQEEDSK